MEKKRFCYLPVAPGAEAWGLTVTGAGFFDTPANTPYPQKGHPEDHMFDWEHGRALSAFQIFYIHRGRGELESKIHPPQKIGVGSGFMLKPGLWHRFRPDPKTGWTESWIEFQGSVPDALAGVGQLGEPMISRPDADQAALDQAIDAVFQKICYALPGINPPLTALAMEVLAAWNRLWRLRTPSAELSHALFSAIQIIEQEYRTPMDLDALARRVGMSYSSFRRSFQKQTGFAPWKYVQRLRLVNARRRLASSDDTLDQIATYYGFSSAFHFSSAFRMEFGISPRQWKHR